MRNEGGGFAAEQESPSPLGNADDTGIPSAKMAA